MRPSVGLLNAAKAVSSTIVKTSTAVGARSAFDSLPLKLVNFFKKYPPASLRQYADKPVSTTDLNANPFMPNRHPVTQKTHDSIYSLRRQSDLYKLAYRYGIQDLLPPILHKKFFEEKYETKVPMKGTRIFKGHKRERFRDARRAEVAEAISKADEIILAAKGVSILMIKICYYLYGTNIIL